MKLQINIDDDNKQKVSLKKTDDLKREDKIRKGYVYPKQEEFIKRQFEFF